jgi:hypothetical protein
VQWVFGTKILAKQQIEKSVNYSMGQVAKIMQVLVKEIYDGLSYLPDRTAKGNATRSPK